MSSCLKPTPSSISLANSTAGLPLSFVAVRRTLTYPPRRPRLAKSTPSTRKLEPYLDSDDESDDDDSVLFFNTASRRRTSISSSSSTASDSSVKTPPCATVDLPPSLPVPSEVKPALKRALSSPFDSQVQLQRPRTVSRSHSTAGEDEHMVDMVSNALTFTYSSSALARNPSALSRLPSRANLSSLGMTPATITGPKDLTRAFTKSAAKKTPPRGLGLTKLTVQPMTPKEVASGWDSPLSVEEQERYPWDEPGLNGRA